MDWPNFRSDLFCVFFLAVSLEGSGLAKDD